MNTNTKNKKKVALLVLLLAIVFAVGTLLLRGTWSYYTSSVEGTATARVAKFDVSLSTDGGYSWTPITTSGGTFTVSLFDTIKDTKDGKDEADVKKDTSNPIIAPGTFGGFNLRFKNDSEVTVHIKSVLEKIANAAGIPIEISLDGGSNWIKYDATNDTINASIVDEDINVGEYSANVNVKWKWAFDGDNAADTADGIDGTATVGLTFDATATQVD